MTLPVQYNTITMNQVNVELNRSGTAAINLNESAVRTLFQKASGLISLHDGHGKSNTYSVNYAICGGGGPGARQHGGGGGAAHVAQGNVTVQSGTAYTIVVGAPGYACAYYGQYYLYAGSIPGDSTALGVTGYGGGRGNGGDANRFGQTNGCGGGAGYPDPYMGQYSTYGNPGNTGDTGGTANGGGGGGMGGAGNGTAGGAYQNNFAGNWAGGGGGGFANGNGGGYGNNNDGGNGAGAGYAGQNPGDGGGGGGNYDAAGADGFRGEVVIRYLGAQRGTGGTITSEGGYTVHRFTTGGTFTA